MTGLLRRRGRAVLALAAGVVALTLTATACSATIHGTGTSALPPVAPDADIDIVDNAHTAFDRDAGNAIADVEAFWKTTYPSLSGGDQLPELKGGIYSVDPDDISADAKDNACIDKSPEAIKDNAFYCTADDSIAYSRTGFVPELAEQYGDFFVAMMFAHEFGHAIQHRLDIADPPSLIILETQADCFAGAFLGSVLALKAPHWRVSPGQVNAVMEGYIQLRDPEGSSQEDEGSHGNGFDRLSAVADGINNGAKFCVTGWDDRQFTERPYTNEADYDNNGNQPLDDVLDPSPPEEDGSGGGGLQPDLNGYWEAAATSIGKKFTDVDFKVVDSLPCTGSDDQSEFAYCPDDNTVYLTRDVAQKAYGAGDFALGTVISYGWGMAVRHQLFDRELDSGDALLAAACYTGAYAKDVNVEKGPRSGFALSPPDMDEATIATLSMVGSVLTFGPRGTTGLQRISAFNKGYFNGLSAC